MGYFYRSSTPYQDVWELPAGCYAYVDINKPEVKITKWWDIHPVYQKRSADTFETALQRTDELLNTAVQRRVESSDLEVGSFLSGGIDSFNVLVPWEQTRYNAYSATRGPSGSNGGLALDRNALLQLPAPANDFALHLEAARQLIQKGDLEKAIYYVNRALTLRPDDPQATATAKELDTLLTAGGGR